MRAKTSRTWLILALAGCLCAVSLGASAAPETATMRVDYFHSGDAKSELYALERIVIEPLPWPGNPAHPIDTSNRGVNKFEIIDAKSGELLYSRGYSTIFGEWQTTDEASSMARGFEESLRFPAPSQPFKVKVFKRDDANDFVPVWETAIDPAATDIERKSMPPSATAMLVHEGGLSKDKVDLLILGDGYTLEQKGKFEADARRLSNHLFTVSPFKERAGDFNVWAMMVPTPESGVSRPSTGVFHASALGSRYDIFGSERYVLALDNRSLREIAQYAAYEFIEILVNNETYGGGGIFGLFSTAAADSAWSNYLFVHEFGHHFAGLADEYYTSAVAYQPSTSHREPWEPNVTAASDRDNLKWRAAEKSETPIPTPWPKAQFEAQSREIQKRRVELRAERRPESEMNALFREELAAEHKLFSASPSFRKVGLFEGANYEAAGYYRSQMQCLMFDRSDEYCQVCQAAISQIIDLYSQP